MRERQFTAGADTTTRHRPPTLTPAHQNTLEHTQATAAPNPYHGESTLPLPALAEELIRSLDYRITVSDFDDSAPAADALTAEGPESTEPTGGEAAARSHPGILLIDGWAVLDEERRIKLKAFDEHARPWVRAIVPWSRTDPQGQGENGRQVKEELERALPRILERGLRAECRTAASGVPTLKAFTDVLPAVVAHTTRQLLKHAEAHPPPGTPPPRVRLTGPIGPANPNGSGSWTGPVGPTRSPLPGTGSDHGGA